MKISILIANPIKAALKATISLFCEAEFVEDAFEANIVIAGSAKDLIPFYCKEREFVIFSEIIKNDQEAKNVHEFKIEQSLDVMIFPAICKEKIEVVPGKPEEIEHRIENKDAKKILVVDDNIGHQKSALALLSAYDLTVATGYDEAMQFLASEKFDVVLTDMEMPMSTKGALGKYVLGKLVPYGLLIEKEASLRGVKHIAVVTNLNHHLDPFAAAFDYFSKYEYIVNESVVKYMHAPMTTINGEYVKDWNMALSNLIRDI